MVVVQADKMLARSVRYLSIVALFLVVPAAAKLVLPSTPPRGFNSFDSYGNINETLALATATAVKAQLLGSGYEYFVLDGGWSESHKTLENGTKIKVQHLDEYGRAIPAPDRYPGGMPALAKKVNDLGLKFGLWTIRGVHKDAVAKKLKVKGTQYTIDQLVDVESPGGGKNGSCLWDSDWLGVNASHPAAQAYYDSRVELLVEQGTDFIKADCMMCGPCYYSEMQMFTDAVKRQTKDITLSYSPGGGNTPKNGKWVADNTIGSMYRTVTDFHGGWYGWGGLQQAIFIAGNFTSGEYGSLHGANGTWADIDMLPLGTDWWAKGVERADRGQTIMTLWSVGKYPLMHAGKIPSDEKTLRYVTDATALAINSDSKHNRVVGYAGNCSCSGGISSCTLGKSQVSRFQVT
jgi:hypothetical protein